MGDVRRLIAFDLDGTLIDSRRDLAESANQLIEEMGGLALDLDQVGRMIGEGARVLVQRALAAAGLPDTADALPRFLDIYDTRLLRHTRVYDGVPAALAAAREHATLVVLTNKPVRPSETILDALGLRGCFAAVVGGDNPLGRKPEPAALRALMADAGVDGATTLMVGDSIVDCDTAHAAGARCCMAGYGFGFLQFPPERRGDAHWVADSPHDLPAILARFAAGDQK